MRSIPDGYVLQPTDSGLPGLEIYRHTYLPIAIAWSGKRSRKDWHYRFTCERALVDYVVEYIRRLESAALAKAKKREALKGLTHDVKVGDVFRCSWGYDQTNVDYYQVVALHGTTQASARQIAASREETGPMIGDCAPVPGAYVGGAFRVRIKTHGSEPSFRITSFSSAYRIRPVVETAGVRAYATDNWSAYA